MRRQTMVEVTEGGDRLDALRNLALIIAAEIDTGGDGHSMAQLVRQYRETLREIAELEDGADVVDEIAELIASHGTPRKAGAD